MTARSLSRASFLAAIAGTTLMALAPAAHAARNAEAEQFVAANAAAAMRTLADRSASPASRRQTFYRLMAQFADMPRIANYVLGRYGPQLNSDRALRTEWIQTFQDYAIAVYEARLDYYTGSEIRVTGSTERTPGRDVIVISEMRPRGQSRALRVQWRVLRSGEGWKVVDVSLIIEGNEIWLAQQQQRDFLAVLDRNNGDIRALVRDVRQQTASMRGSTSG